MTTTQRPRRTHAPRGRIAAGLAAAAIAATLAGAELGTASTAAAATTKACVTPDFTDVRAGTTFYRAITWLRCEDISRGYANNAYAPGKLITRGETAELLYRYSGANHDPGRRIDFKDVPTSRSAFTAVSWMEEKGYTTGYRDGTYGVDKPLSRGELAAFLYRMAGQSGFRAPATAPFSDVAKSHAFYGAAAWMHHTGLVSGYADGTFRPGRSVTRGETAQFLYAMESTVNGAPPSYKVTVQAPGLAPNPTRGSGGPVIDAMAQSYGNGTVSSNYHLYSAHLKGTAPHGVIVYLHGDGGWEYKDRQYSPTAKYAELARKHNMLLVVPKTPDRDGTWWGEKTSGAYAADLLDHLGTRYNLDLNRTYWVGFSGGADVLTEQVVQTHSDGWTGGAALILGGGPGTWGYLGQSRPLSDSVKRNFPMHWVVGEYDTPSKGGSSGSYDALRAAKDGHAHYTGRGMKTSIEILPKAKHVDAAWAGPAKLAEILARR